MKKSLCSLFLAFIVTIITCQYALAQKTSKFNVSIKAEDVYGKWVVAQVMTMNAFLGIPEPKVAPVDTANHSTGQDTTLAGRQAAMKSRITNHLTEIQAKSTLVLSPDHTGVKYIGLNPFNITWKLKKNIISAKNLKTKEKIRMEVVKFSADQLMVLEHSQYGDTYISYKRAKE